MTIRDLKKMIRNLPNDSKIYLHVSKEMNEYTGYFEKDIEIVKDSSDDYMIRTYE